MDPTTAIDVVHRGSRHVSGRQTRPDDRRRAPLSHSARRSLGRVTSPERIPRWFLPISGDLRLGGRYQLEGNAEGTITTCDPPRHLAVTWSSAEERVRVDVHLAETGADTTLRLEHVILVEDIDDRWDEFGPGAVGVGWDLTMLGLAEHLATGADITPDPADAGALEVMRRSSDGWGRASIAYGTPPDQAEAAAGR